MEKFTVHTGLVVPLDRHNVDTDAIIPKQFLKSIKRSGFGVNLFDAWRYLDHGEPGMDAAKRKPNPDFVLNQSRYKGKPVTSSTCFATVKPSSTFSKWAFPANSVMMGRVNGSQLAKIAPALTA